MDKRSTTFRIFFIVAIGYLVLAFHSGSLHQVIPIDFRGSEFRNEEICNCSSRAAVPRKPDRAEQWCSPGSSSRGDKQKVVTYSLFGNSSNSGINAKYFQLLDSLPSRIQEAYPGWIVRVYHNFPKTDVKAMSQLCHVYCQNPHVDLCKVAEVQRDPETEKLTNNTGWEKLNPRMWRFLALVDPQVDYVVSRDMDAIITEREVAAVQQWIDSNYTFHLMRDHPFHAAIMLAGMWGAKLFQYRSLIRDIIRTMLRHGMNQAYSTDQILLKRYFWPVARFDV